MSHAPPRVPKPRRPWDAALPPVSGSRLAGSPAWQGLPECPGYGHWISCCCVALMFWFGFRGDPAFPRPGLGWVCLGTGFGFAPPFLAGVCGVCRWAWVLVCPLPLVAGVLWRAWLCARSACTPPFLALVCGVGVCATARVSAAPRHSWQVCWGLCVFVCVLRLYSPLLAGVCGVVVCAWAPVSAAPRHSWFRCWGVCAFVCALLLYPATPGWGVRCGCDYLGSGCGCTLPLLAGVLGCVCACVRAPLVPRHSWLGCAVWLCVLGLGSRLQPATPCCGIGVCVFLCACSACTPPILPGVCGVVVCVSAQVLAAPRHTWMLCWGVSMFLCRLRLYPTTSGWGVRRGSVCSGPGFSCPRILARVFGCVCVCVRAALRARQSWLGCALWVCVLGLGFRLRPATPGWGVGTGVFLCARSACTPPLLVGVCGVCVCVFELGFRLRPATPGSGVGVCVCFCARSACTPPLLAGVCGVGVCAWARV